MGTNKDFKRLTQSELDQELASLEERLSRTAGVNRVKNLFQNLRIHQVELEMQNRELRETLTALDDVRDRYADLYDFAPIGYMTLERRGIVREINLTGARMLGRPRSELLDRPLVPRLEPGYSRAFFSHLNQAFEGPVKAEVELALRTRSGQTPWVLFESVRVRSGNATVCRTAMIDVSERRRVEDGLRHCQAQLWRVIDAVPALVAYLDHDMRYRFANTAHRQWLGIEPEQVIGKRMDELMDDEAAAVLKPYVSRVMAGEEVSFENKLVHRELGGRRVHVRLIPDSEGRGDSQGFYAVFTDVPGGGRVRA